MVKLRLASLADFESFRKLYINAEHKYQWLYEDPSKTNEPEGKAPKEFEEEAELAKEEFSSLTYERFEKILTNVYMIDNQNTVVGYVRIEGSSYFCKIVEWAVIDDKNEATKVATLEALKKMLRRGKIQVGVSRKEAQEFFLRNGFTTRGGGFFEIEIGKRK